MMGFPLKFWVAGLVMCVVSACSSEANKTTDLSRLIAGELVNIAKAKRDGPPQQVNVSAEDFAKIKIPLLQVNLLDQGGTDFLKRSVSRRDAFGGTVEVWESQSKAQLFLRNGIVVGTRGIGDNIISADASYLVKALAAGKSSRGERRFTLSDGDLTVSKISLVLPGRKCRSQ